jgi:hypothetical protein
MGQNAATPQSTVFDKHLAYAPASQLRGIVLMLFSTDAPKKAADMELYAALDLHSNNSVLVVTDLEDHAVFAKRLRNDLELIVSALRGCPGAIRAVAVEST